MLGLARALCDEDGTHELIYELQQGLYKLMAELATPSSQIDKVDFVITSKDVSRLDSINSDLKTKVAIGKVFVVPGSSTCGAALDVARTTVRRGERLAAHLVHDGEVTNQYVLQWLNRLSDTIFVLARYVERPR